MLKVTIRPTLARETRCVYEMNKRYLAKAVVLFKSEALYIQLGSSEVCSVEYKATAGNAACWLIVSHANTANVNVRYVASRAIHDHF